MAVRTAAQGGNRVIIAQYGTTSDALDTVAWTYDAISDLAKNGKPGTQDLSLVITHGDIGTAYETFVSGTLVKVAQTEGVDFTTVDNVVTTISEAPPGTTAYVVLSVSGVIGGTTRKLWCSRMYFASSTESNDSANTVVTAVDTWQSTPTPAEWTITSASIDALISDLGVSANADIVIPSGGYGKIGFADLN